MDPKHLIPGDAVLIEYIVNYLKAKGIFDEFRHECLADVDTKSSCQNLSQRIDGYTSKFLANETWHSDSNKNEMRNKLRRHISESGLLAVGADHVVEQVINTKIYPCFFPKIFEVVHQFVKEQSDSLYTKQEANTSNESTSEKTAFEALDNKDTKIISDPIADILSFSYSKSKPPPVKTEIIQQKHIDPSKVKKEEKTVHILERSNSEKSSENLSTSDCSETKAVIEKDKEKIKKGEQENSQESNKKVVREEVKLERKKSEDVKALTTETASSSEVKKIKKESSDKSFDKNPCESNISNEVKKPKTEPSDKSSEKNGSEISTINEAKKPKKETSDKSSEKNGSEAGLLSDETKTSTPTSVKPVLTSKKDFDKNKQKSKPGNVQKSSNDLKKSKKESSDKSTEKHFKSKPSKSVKESSPTKQIGLSKNLPKEEKRERSKSSDSSSNKASESSLKKTKSSSSKKDSGSLKLKETLEKTDKSKSSKSTDKSDNSHIHPDSSNSEKSSKNIHYSSSYDSSQGSDQEKSSSGSKKERLKHFSKHAKKEKSDNSDSGSRSHEKKRIKDSDECSSKKHKSERDAKFSFKDNTVTEAAKISSRSNSFGSTSSVSSSSNASKDNLGTNSEDLSESSTKDKKKKQPKDKDSCHNPSTPLPPPPPPPPPSGSVSCELTSSAEPSSMEDTQSSSENESSVSDEEISEASSSDSELESKDLIQSTLKESALNSSTDNINAFYDIFLYSSSSSEFEGYENSPEKKKPHEDVNKKRDSEMSVSSVHTSDLSSYDDELSSDEDVSLLTGGVKKRLTLKEAQELLRNRAILREKNKNTPAVDKKNTNEVLVNKRCSQRSSSLLSSEEESSPSEPVRSLRRERKLNPRYASSEYTSIFNCRKETFITKQSSPSLRNSFLDSSPNTELKNKNSDALVQINKSTKKNSFESKLDAIQKEEIKQPVKDKNLNASSRDDLSGNSDSSSSDEIDSIMNDEKLFQANNKTDSISDNDKFKLSMKFSLQNNSKLNVNKYSLKRKNEVRESTPVKRPCSRSSVDSSSSEIVSNENRPFNNEKQRFEEKVLKDNLRASGLTDGIKKDLFCKQRTNNNGDVLGQKDIFSKNSHSKTINNSEKKTNES